MHVYYIIQKFDIKNIFRKFAIIKLKRYRNDLLTLFSVYFTSLLLEI